MGEETRYGIAKDDRHESKPRNSSIILAIHIISSNLTLYINYTFESITNKRSYIHFYFKPFTHILLLLRWLGQKFVQHRKNFKKLYGFLKYI